MYDILSSRIFDEIKQSSVNKYYAELLLDRQTSRSKWYSFLISVISIVGVIAAFQEQTFWVITISSIVALATIFNQFLPYFLLGNETVNRLISLQHNCIIYHHKLSDLFTLLDAEKIPEEEAQQKFSKLRIDYAPDVIEIAKIFGTLSTKLEERAQTLSDLELGRIYNSDSEENIQITKINS